MGPDTDNWVSKMPMPSLVTVVDVWEKFSREVNAAGIDREFATPAVDVFTPARTTSRSFAPVGDTDGELYVADDVAPPVVCADTSTGVDDVPEYATA